MAQVRDGFFDPARGPGWAGANARYAAEARGQDDFAAATRAALRQLNASHTAYDTTDNPEFHGLQAISRRATGGATADRWDSIGVAVAPGGFARVVFAGSPAAQAGPRRGDQILRADGLNFPPVRSLRGRSGRAVTLTVRGRRDEPPRDPGREVIAGRLRGPLPLDEGRKVVGESAGRTGRPPTSCGPPWCSSKSGASRCRPSTPRSGGSPSARLPRSC